MFRLRTRTTTVVPKHNDLDVKFFGETPNPTLRDPKSEFMWRKEQCTWILFSQNEKTMATKKCQYFPYSVKITWKKWPTKCVNLSKKQLTVMYIWAINYKLSLFLKLEKRTLFLVFINFINLHLCHKSLCYTHLWIWGQTHDTIVIKKMPLLSILCQIYLLRRPENSVFLRKKQLVVMNISSITSKLRAFLNMLYFQKRA